MKKRICLMIIAFVCLFVSCSQEGATPDALISSVTVSTYNEKEGRTNVNPVNGQPLVVYVVWKNNSGTGTLLFGGDISYKCYLSKDENLSSDDVILVNDGKLSSYSSSSTGRNWVSSFSCKLPPSTAAGTYYCIFVRTNGEKGDFIKVSSAFTVDKFVSLGAFKVYNSWGKEFGKDGYYYIPFEKVISMGVESSYYIHNKLEDYDPVLVATFKFKEESPGAMQDYMTYFTLSQGMTEIATKSFIVDTSAQQALPSDGFSALTTYTCDLSDFCSDITNGSYTIKLSVDPVDSTKTNPVKLDNMTVSVYNNGYRNGSSSHDETDASSSSATRTISIKKTDITAIPVARAIQITGTDIPNTRSRAMTEEEKEALNNRKPETPYVTEDGHHTGLVKAKDLSAYDGMQIIESTLSEDEAKAMIDRRVSYGTSKDLSTTQYFPPCGNQGRLGCCVAYATTYYIMTYEMAMENGWDLTGVVFNDALDHNNPDYSTWGPSDRNHIMSPAFTYNQLNGGEDKGIQEHYAYNTLSSLGCCTWDKMDATFLNNKDGSLAGKQPTTDAYKEAPIYRISDNAVTVKDYAFSSVSDIEMAMEMLDSGHLLGAGIDSACLYYTMNKNGVIVGGYPMNSLNHAQTIVGYVTGEEYEKLLNQ